jgi:ABC-type transport system involved in cytochrome c biogenesis permease subunit
MGPKLTYQGLLIYLAMAGYLAAAVAYLMRPRPTAGIVGYRAGSGVWSMGVGEGAFMAGFVSALAAVAYRWTHVRHLPLQNMFEVFLFLGMLVYPLSVFCRRLLGVRGALTDAVIGFVLLFPAGFIFTAEPLKLPPALQCWIFAPHVAAYMLAYVIMAKAAVEGTAQLITHGGADPKLGVAHERATYNLVCLGFPLLTLGLVLGALWGNLAWGDYWNWDPKELWSLVSWLVYLAYLHLRYMFGTRHPRVNSILAVGGLLAIISTLLWVNLSRIFGGMHSYAA